MVTPLVELDFNRAVARSFPEDKERIMQTFAETLFQRGREAGLKEGREAGLERGLEQGLERGLERGLEQGLLSSVEAFAQGKFGAKSVSLARRRRLKGIGADSLAALAKATPKWNA